MKQPSPLVIGITVFDTDGYILLFFTLKLTPIVRMIKKSTKSNVDNTP